MPRVCCPNHRRLTPFECCVRVASALAAQSARAADNFLSKRPKRRRRSAAFCERQRLLLAIASGRTLARRRGCFPGGDRCWKRDARSRKRRRQYDGARLHLKLATLGARDSVCRYGRTLVVEALIAGERSDGVSSTDEQSRARQRVRRRAPRSPDGFFHAVDHGVSLSGWNASTRQRRTTSSSRPTPSRRYTFDTGHLLWICASSSRRDQRATRRSR